MFGKSAHAIIQSILDNPEDKPNIEQLVHKRMKNKVQDLEISIEGDVTPEQAEKTESSRNTMMLLPSVKKI